MADPFHRDPSASFDPGAARAKDELNARFQDLRRDAASNARAAADSLEDRYGAADAHGTTASSIRDQASKAAEDARGAAASLAEQARARMAEIVDQQKAAGAAKIAGVATAARSAAGDLDKTNPQMARLVRSAAESVDRIAADVRSSDIGTVVGTVADFGRRQPVAFFGGAVLAGFLLSRFFKSDVPVIDEASLHGDRAPI